MLFLPALAAQATTVELYRGASLGTPGYWAVEDTYLDKAEPGEDHGGGFTVLGGDGRTILLRFGDLARVLGKGRRVVSATLVLTPSGGDVPRLHGVTAVDAIWTEGPWSTLTKILAKVESDPKAKRKPVAARGAATWAERRAGIAPWSTPGTPGGPAVAATGTADGKGFEISGLGATVQGWADHPWTNHGLALNFAGDVEFFSSQSPSGRPRLVVTTAPGGPVDYGRPDLAVTSIAKEGGKWTARVRNLGPAPAGATKAVWWADGKPGAEVAIPALAAGAEATLVYAGPEPKDDAQVPTLGLAVTTGDEPVHANDRLDVFPGGRPVYVNASAGVSPNDAIDYWNETVATQSRFSFAPEGVKGRVRLDQKLLPDSPSGVVSLSMALRQIGAQLGLPSPPSAGDLYPGLMGYGDTRFEGTVPGRLSLPYEPYPDPATATALLEPTGLLSATDVGRLNDGGDRLPLPKVVLLNVVDLSDRPLPGLEVAIEQPGGTTTKAVTGPNGSLLLPSGIAFKGDLSNGALTLRATANGVTSTDVVKAWHLSDAYRRSDSPAVVVPVRLNLPMVPLETGTDLADGKPLTDSEGKPYVLGAPMPTKAGAWVEIDLGRDRTIGEIALKPGPEFWSRYEIRVYSTGGRSDDAGLWASELDADWARRNRAEDGWLAYRTPVQRIRFVRVVSRSGGAASLAGVRVVPIRIVSVNGP